MELTSGDSKLPEIFQEPEEVIAKSFEPKKVTGTENLIEEKKDVEITVEQEKKALQRPRRFVRTRNSGTVVDAPRMKITRNPGTIDQPRIRASRSTMIKTSRNLKAPTIKISKTKY